jgi:hypothetical protein
MEPATLLVNALSRVELRVEIVLLGRTYLSLNKHFIKSQNDYHFLKTQIN